MRNRWLLMFGSAGVMGVVGAGAGVLRFPEAASQPPVAVTPKMQAPPEARAMSRAFAATAKALQPSVVRIDVESSKQLVKQERPDRRSVPPEFERFFERFFGEGYEGPPGPTRGTGSGLVMDGQGNILTNSHVVANAAKVTVTFADGRELTAKVVGHDAKTDVAVIRLERPPQNLVAARIGDSAKVEVGEWVLAVGSPLGLDQSVTAGIISGKGRVGRNVQMSGERMREYIQTDAKINPGNSGGPLVNLDGEVIGINTLINTGPGGAYGFAIPINQAQRVAQSIMTNGRMRHAWMGVGLADVKDGVLMAQNGQPARQQRATKDLPTRAAWVIEVRASTPASGAGMRVGDVITTIDNKKIDGALDVIDYVSSRGVGDKVVLAYLREGRPGTVQITLGELPENLEASQAPPPSPVGVGLQDLTPEMARHFGLGQDTKGAVVTDVIPGSRAAKAQLRAEDVIIEINRKPITSAAEAAEALKADAKEHLVRIRRGTSALYITIPK